VGCDTQFVLFRLGAHLTVQARKSVQALPPYRPGKAAEQANIDGDVIEAVKLSSNETPYPPIPAVIEAMVDAARNANRYPDNSATELRRALAELVSVAPENVAVGSGSSSVLQQIFLSYVEPGEEVVYPWRSFEVYPIYTQMVGGTEVAVPLLQHAFELDAVANAITDRTKLIVLATPNNPTGTALTPDAVHKFLRAVPPSVLVVLDQAYKEFTDPSFALDVRRLIDDFSNVVIVRTFSKAHGLAGVRLGYAVAHPNVIEAVNKTLIPFSVSAVAQAGALAAVRSIEEIEARAADIVAERSRILSTLASQGWNIPASQGNFFYLPLGQRTMSVYSLLESRGIVTRPFPPDGIRITIGTVEQNDRVLQALTNVSPS
jgi:histidinol-phosphate aminotransferase